MHIRSILVIVVLLAAGPLSAAWQENGAPIAEFGQYQSDPVVASDGAGGMIAAWIDDRDGLPRLYVQRVNGFGDPLWASGGVLISGEGSDAAGARLSTE